MMRLTSILVGLMAITMAALVPSTDAFAVPSGQPAVNRASTAAFMAKKKVDLSDIESRDLTREEMLELNRKNEDETQVPTSIVHPEIMNMELSMMTGFSLVISLPILYLCWVAFFSD